MTSVRRGGTDVVIVCGSPVMVTRHSDPRVGLAIRNKLISKRLMQSGSLSMQPVKRASDRIAIGVKSNDVPVMCVELIDRNAESSLERSLPASPCTEKAVEFPDRRISEQVDKIDGTDRSRPVKVSGALVEGSFQTQVRPDRGICFGGAGRKRSENPSPAH